MLLDNHFEDLTFSEDRLINTSHTFRSAMIEK